MSQKSATSRQHNLPRESEKSLGGLLQPMKEHDAGIQTSVQLSNNCGAMDAAKDPTSRISWDIVMLLNLKE